MTMQFSPRQLRALAAQASSIDERIYKDMQPEVRPGNEELIQQRWDNWCQTLVKGDWTQFQGRLAWDQLKEQRARNILGAVRWPQEEALPDWTEILQEALRTTTTVAGQSNTYPFYDPADPQPFEQILAPFVLAATTRLRAYAGNTYDLLSEQAHISLQRKLLTGLAFYAFQALQLEFSIERSLSMSSFARLLQASDDKIENECYLNFVARMRQGGLLDFLQEYAVLARQLATIMQLWIEFLAEFLQRLEQDQGDIQKILASSEEPGQVVAIEAGLSDPHQGRRSVLALTFAGGQKLIYKPKDLGIEEAFQHLLRWISVRDHTLTLKALQMVVKPGYAWVEFVDHRACQTEEEARRYFQRVGILLCLVYVLEGTDCHRANLIAHGEDPVLVDSEALMQPRQRLDDIADGVLARYLAQEQLLHSVLRTGMLPSWEIHGAGKNQRAHDISALGGMQVREETLEEWTWEHVNTDQMDWCLKAQAHQLHLTGPMLGDRFLQAEDYCSEIVDAFRRMHRFLREQRTDLLGAEGPVAKMAQQPVRFIYRDTQVYGDLSRRLIAPEFQRDGISRSIQLELLGRVLIPQASERDRYTQPSSWWPIFASERQAMQLEDIPYYTSQPDSDALRISPGTPIPALFQQPSAELVANRLRSLDEEDMEKQVGFIVGSLYTHVARHKATATEMARSEPEERFALPEPAELVEQALRIAEQLQQLAVRANKSATWIAPQFLYRAERYQLQPLNNDLYTGLSGIALFLAAASRVADARDFRELALATIHPIRMDIKQGEDELADILGIGGASGLGSLIFAFAHLGQILDEPALLREARKMVDWITDERVQADSTHDICDGVAGTILGLLALYNLVHDPIIIERAEACAAHLVRSATIAANGRRAWVTITDRMLTGFSHGVAGIAYALLRLYTITGKDEYRALASESIDYEDSLFVHMLGNWQDLLAEDPLTQERASWCHGAPGIGLARIGGLPGLDTTQVRGDIDAAVTKMLGLPLYGVDFVCCGNMGIIDILLVCAQRLRRPELREVALRRAGQVLARTRRTEMFRLDPQLPRQLYNPSFFQGTAGIGYTCLRLAQPEMLPSVLLWE